MVGKYSKVMEKFIDYARIIFKKYSVPRWLVFINDSVIVFLTFLLAYLLRFNFMLSAFVINLALLHALLTLFVYSSFSLIFKSFSGLIRHTTITDIFKVVSCNTFSLVVLISISLLGRNLNWNVIFIIPLSILVIHYGIISVIQFLVRVLIKLTFEFISISAGEKKNVLIFGAGARAILVKKIIQTDSTSGYRTIGLIDDNKKLQGKELEGMRVYSTKILDSVEFLEKNSIKVLIIAVDDISPTRKSELIQMALVHNMEVLETPKVKDWLNGDFQVKHLRKVKLEDLLGREQIKLDMTRLEQELLGKTVLVTGAAGSIGSEITRQLTRFNIKLLVLVDQAETPMFYLNTELIKNFNFSSFRIILADVTNRGKMENIFRDFSPEIVFHAAAYKHVSMMEMQPHEAIHINVGGTKTMADLAIRYQVSKFVMVSTDKAVNPTSIMGAAKRICELYIQSQSERPEIKTQFVTTRFGNVLGSNGSVVPLFKKQIESGGPVLVTHPDVSRYFMTIPEACQLVLEAGFMGQGGEIFVVDMGKPVKIKDLAEQMIRLSGYIPGEDIEIKYIGLRSGEKLSEELLTDKDMTQQTHHPKIMIARTRKEDNRLISFKINNLLKQLNQKTTTQIVLEMIQLVPEFESNNEKFKALVKINKGYSKLLNFHETWTLSLGSDHPSNSQSSSKQGA
jgi:FlaA1/EpsC-like NDP-sugar epimerase